jgi:hypothetical protein
MALLPIVRKPPIAYLVDCGSAQDYQDARGTLWLADRAYTADGWGYVGETLTWSTVRYVTGAEDDHIYRTLRFGAGGSFGYRFDVPNGEYEIELHFAEIYAQFTKPKERVFDVMVEMQLVPELNDLDVIAQAGGPFRVLVKTVRADVSDGQLNVTFARDWAQGADNPMVNAIRVTKVD